MSTKSRLREQMRRVRAGIEESQRRVGADSIAERAMAHAAFSDVRNVALYSSIRDEVDTRPLFDALSQRGVQLLYPRVVEPTKVLEFAPVLALEELRTGAFNVQEPESAAVDLVEVELVVAPGLAFDTQGRRLGYGAGCYDRTLESYGGLVVGLAFDEQIVDEVPVDSCDRPVDLIVTPERVIAVKGAGA